MSTVITVIEKKTTEIELCDFFYKIKLDLRSPGRQGLLQPSAPSQHPECLKFSATDKNTAVLSDVVGCGLDLKPLEDTNLEELVEVRDL